MSRYWLRRFFPLIAFVLLAPWPIAYAYDNVAAAPEVVRIEAAVGSALPAATVFGNAVNRITPGELFTVDAAARSGVFAVTLILTNVDELSSAFRQVTLRIAVQRQGPEGDWAPALDALGNPLAPAPVTLRNSELSFDLAGEARYRVVVEGGSLAARSIKNGAVAAPNFQLGVD